MSKSIPIVFAFDNNLAMPAAVCFYSLFVNANKDTSYKVYVLHRQREKLDTVYIDKIFAVYPQHSLHLLEVDGTFDDGFEIRGITSPAYYRLLIPKLLPEYDKVIYSDVDVIFRDDLSKIFDSHIGDNFYLGVNAMAFLDHDLNKYYIGLGLNPNEIIYSGNLIVNIRKFKDNENTFNHLIETAKKAYKFQDMDAINIACRNKIGYVGPEFCLTTYIGRAMLFNKEALLRVWAESQLDIANSRGLIHYNGTKPWKGWCLNFDIWWEYYRKSPIFNPDFYFKFYYNRLEELDTLPLMKRVKNLVRYFVYGRKKPL